MGKLFTISLPSCSFVLVALKFNFSVTYLYDKTLDIATKNTDLKEE
jgi:hypothetical protein